MQAVVRIPQEKEKQCGAAHARDQRTQCRTRYPHPEYKDQKRVEADVGHIHHQRGKHGDAGVSLHPEERR